MTDLSADVVVGDFTVPFVISRPYLNFRICGGDYEYKTCLNVVVNGQVVRTETGRATERPHAATFDLTEWLGQDAHLELVDEADGEWGYVRVSDIVLSSTPTVVTVKPPLYAEALRPQLHFTARQWAMHRLNPVEREEGWLNDLNGLVFHDGEYHLFAQRWNKCWIHAISNDLVHWTELEPAFFEESLGTGVQSGSCVVDVDNTSGLAGPGEGPAMVAFWSRNDNRSQCVSYSLDRGRTWTHYAGNPIMDLPERDPMVFRDHRRAQWVMVLYGDDRYQLLRSDDLLHWESLNSSISNSFECPDFFELGIAGSDESRWALVRGDGRYSIGTFDGHTFVEETPQLQVDGGPHFYATQSWAAPGGGPHLHAPQGWAAAGDGTTPRRIQLAWMRGGRYPNMPFNQQVSIPCDLTLQQTPDGLRMYRQPVPELQTLSRTRHTWPARVLSPGTPWQIGTAWPLLRITCNATLAPNAELTLTICGTQITVTSNSIAILTPEPTPMSADQPTATAAKQPTITAVGKLDIVVDTTSVEVFANGGEASLTACVQPGHYELTLTASGTDCSLGELEVVELASIWPAV
ncbi:fructan beta-fructosidase [Kribbella rubisoli]|uniref:Fructan beta-fructosidase n=1 Tax=Kribbella rubisoli TaxID=3075929 RepID=A0A4Q7XA42_9ACTN|nr:glycoside hydrolase family 32 protein [Kribbella rubisoli]RZU20001.1 fructan beta-fructosidase [Kribbella rubisoli]